MELQFIINSSNQLIWLNEAARTALGYPAQEEPPGVRKIFGVAQPYQRIEKEAFNFRWTGQLPLFLSDGTGRVFTGRGKWVTNELCVFNQIFLAGRIPADSETIAEESHEEMPVLQTAELRKVYEISSSINSSLDFQSICADVTRKAAELVGADRSLLYNVTDQAVGVFSTWNMTAPQRALFSMVDFRHGIIKNCLKARSPVLVPAYSLHVDWIPEIYAALNFESFILFPLYAGERLVGVLALFKTEALYFGDRHLMLLQMISNQMAIAVLNAQTYSDMRSITINLERELGLKNSQLQISELALIRKSNELAAVFDALTDALFVMDSNFAILEVNQAGTVLVGEAGHSSLIGRIYCDVVGRHFDCRRCYLRQTLESGLPQSLDLDVEDRIFTVTTYPVLDEAGRVSQVVCALRDVTLVRRKGADLIQAQKMQAIGTLAAGVAHEIRNPLGAISNYVYLLEDRMTGEAGEANREEVHDALRGIRRLINRSEAVIRNLLDFSREKAPLLSVFRMKDVVEQILLLVGKTAQKKKVVIRVAGDSDLQVKSDSGAMQHILFNLVINAIDAVNEAGDVEISYSRRGSGFLLSVSDSGSGIPVENIDKIFHPFFTTKGPDRGTGLGLYLVYNEVKRLGGNVSVESAPGGPTRFNVTIA